MNLPLWLILSTSYVMGNIMRTNTSRDRVNLETITATVIAAVD